eukprot:g32790.t1
MVHDRGLSLFVTTRVHMFYKMVSEPLLGLTNVEEATVGATDAVDQNKELTLTKCCRLAHSKIQDYVLRVTLNLGAAAAKGQWGKTIVRGLPAE